MKKYLLLIVSVIVAFSCRPQVVLNKQNENKEITILHTNDIHGNIDNFPRLAFLVDSIRKIHKNILLLNAGDIFTGNPYVDMYEDKGFPVIDLMNDIGFDLSALGNHEFDYGQEVLNRRIKQAKFPFICSNIEYVGGILAEQKKEYTLKTGNGIIINIFSLLDNSANGLPQTHPSNVKGLKFENGIEIAHKYKKLKNGANVFLALNHMGIEADEILAKQMPELDLIVGGHSHTTLESAKLVNGVLIAQTGSRLSYLGEITLSFVDGKITSKYGKLIPINKNGNVDPSVKKKVEKYSKNVYFEQVVGQSRGDFKNREELGSLMTDAYRDYGNFDISFQNSGGIRINELGKGNITRGQIYQLDPFGNYLVKLEMKLDEIKSLIINSFKENEIDIRVSGITYNLITENGIAKDVIIKDYNGNTISKDKTYKVLMNDYILNTYKFDHSDKGTNLGNITSDALLNYLKKGTVNYSGVKRTFIDGK